MSEIDFRQELDKFLENVPHSASGRERVEGFYRLLCIGNESQNLTRLISPRDFLDGHLVDCLEAQKSRFFGDSAVDLGSGCGVPGLLMACLNPERRWSLVESEFQKAKFLTDTTSALGLSSSVSVCHGRVETSIGSMNIDTIASRAVGSVIKILGWIDSSSTWNNLVLFKGPSWDREEAELMSSKFSKKIKVDAVHRYVCGPEKKQRVIVKLVRVPRGTG